MLFSNMQATGNDFVVIDNRNAILDVKNTDLWIKLCNRKIGVGADGVLLLEKSKTQDFKMRYINSDGTSAKMCGNGARAIFYFASSIGIHGDGFETDAGVYQAQISDTNYISLKMRASTDEGAINLNKFNNFKNAFYLNTGVGHAVFEVDSIDDFDGLKTGREIRNDQIFPDGVNVNFFEVQKEGEIVLRTYEQGVEDITLSCGTGSVAAAICYKKWSGYQGDVLVNNLGGALDIKFKGSNIYLCGKVEKIFTGSMDA